MTASDDLFDLIKSLVPSEKRYFKVFAQQYRKEIDCIKLFEAIEKQKKYDEQQIKKAFKEEDFIRHFAVVKKRLHSLVLKSLHYFHSNQDSELRELLHYVDILYEKGLRDQCEKILKKTKQVAEKNEKYPSVFAVMEWEERMMISHSDVKLMKQKISEHEDQIKSVVQKYMRRKQFRNLLFEITVLTHTIEKPRSKAEIKLYDDILKHPLLKEKPETLSHFENELYANIHCIYYVMREDYQGAYPYAENHVELQKELSLRSRGDMLNYIGSLNNLMVCQIETGRFEDFRKNLNESRNLPVKFSSLISENVYRQIINTTYTLEFTVCERQGDFKEGLNVVVKALEELDKLKASADDQFRMILYFNFAYIYFGTEDYSSAKIYLNKIINEIDPAIRIYILTLAKILNLIINFDQGNYDTLEYIAKSTQRFLSARERLFKTELVMLNFFNKEIPKAANRKETLEAFQKLKEKFIILREDPDEKSILDSFDFLSWIDSKIEDKPFAEIVKRKALKKEKTLNNL